MIWTVLRVRIGSENKLTRSIPMIIENKGLSQYLGDILVIREKVCVIRNGKKVIKEKNQFPGYVFLKIEDINELRKAVLSIPGVFSFVRSGRNIDHLTSEYVEGLRVASDSVDVNLGYDLFKVGESVKIITGAFANYTGVIETVDRSKERMRVLVSMFLGGNVVPLDVTFAQVEKIS